MTVQENTEAMLELKRLLGESGEAQRKSTDFIAWDALAGAYQAGLHLMRRRDMSTQECGCAYCRMAAAEGCEV